MVRRSIKYKCVQNIFDCDGKIEACAVEVSAETKSFFLISCYHPPQSPTISIREWVQFLTQFGSNNVFFGGDFNSHNEEWGFSHTCHNGTNLSEALRESELNCLNEGAPTMLNDCAGPVSVVDLSLTHESIALRFQQVVLSDTWGSDHYPVSVRATFGIQRNQFFRKKNRLYNIKTKWEIFKKIIENDIINYLLTPPEEVGILYPTFISLIEQAVYAATPRRNADGRPGDPRSDFFVFYKTSPPPCPWWDAECDRLVRCRKAALLKFRFSGSRQDFIGFRKCAAHVRTELRRIKQENFRNFCATLNIGVNPSVVWRAVKVFQSRWAYKERASEFKPEKQRNILDMLHKLFPPWVPVSGIIFNIEKSDHFLDQDFTTEELNLALAQVNTKSTPGMDRIDYRIIKELPKLGKRTLLNIYNLILKSGEFPNDWRKYRVFFIPKSGGRGFRPISLSSCLCKTIEKMLSHRIMWWLERHDIFPKAQYGFRNRKSCIDYLAILFSESYVAFQKNKYVAATFLDIQAAYDNVLYDILIQRLNSIGFSPRILTFIQNLTALRYITCQVGESEISINAHKGLPQGSALSPVLYTLYVL